MNEKAYLSPENAQQAIREVYADQKQANQTITSELFDIRSYIGYSEDDVLGVNVDFDDGLYKRSEEHTSELQSDVRSMKI